MEWKGNLNVFALIIIDNHRLSGSSKDSRRGECDEQSQYREVL
jgi:hypothetical protein